MARPPKPTALKLIGGNAGKRALPKNEPDPLYLNDLTPPEHLSDAAKKVWDDLAPKLRRANVLTELDGQILELGCNAIVMYRLATSSIGENALTRSPETGNVSPNPWMIVQSMMFKQATAVLKEMGMTPTARSRVMVNPQDDLFGDALGNYLKAKPGAA
jgi:P27 family predicted phage terminase small subunit